VDTTAVSAASAPSDGPMSSGSTSVAVDGPCTAAMSSATSSSSASPAGTMSTSSALGRLRPHVRSARLRLFFFSLVKLRFRIGRHVLAGDRFARCVAHFVLVQYFAATTWEQFDLKRMTPFPGTPFVPSHLRHEYPSRRVVACAHSCALWIQRCHGEIVRQRYHHQHIQPRSDCLRQGACEQPEQTCWYIVLVRRTPVKAKETELVSVPIASRSRSDRRTDGSVLECVVDEARRCFRMYGSFDVAGRRRRRWRAPGGMGVVRTIVDSQ